MEELISTPLPSRHSATSRVYTPIPTFGRPSSQLSIQLQLGPVNIKILLIFCMLEEDKLLQNHLIAVESTSWLDCSTKVLPNKKRFLSTTEIKEFSETFML
jgi:hypothetical protein